MRSSPIGPSARLHRERLDGTADPVAAARWLRGEPRAVALSGAWAGGGVLLASHPLVVAAPDDDPFALLDAQPQVDVAAAPDAVGGGWLGWLGFGLARALEPVPPPPPRPAPLPLATLAFFDHVVRCDADGAWWFEALWTDERAGALRERAAAWRARLAQGAPPPARPYRAGPLRAAAPGTAGHAAAVVEGVERIAAGEVFQANLCLRLDGPLEGDLLDVWVAAATQLGPAYAAYVAGDDHAVASLSPELFLRRRGRTVVTEPIKGTAPASSDPAALAGSAKDRAENVMIADLMRNDLGRVCAYGSVAVPRLFEVRPAAGVWHLVSTVTGTLRDDVDDADLLRATFPPGSVTGAPKIRALRVISELEATAREAYCGAIGLASPVAGLELNVAIRTFEARDGRLWLGAGGGIVSDSEPDAEVAEALAKARGVAQAAGITLAADAPNVHRTRSSGRWDDRSTPRLVTLPRPDPARGLLETILAVDGSPVDLDAHLARLTASAQTLGLALPRDLAQQVADAARDVITGRVRVVLDAHGAHVSTGPLPQPGPTTLHPVTLPGGLGAHKWADRTLVDALAAPGATPLFCDLDGHVLEAGYAAFLIVEDGRLVAPPLDGRILPSTSRARLDADEEPITLERARAADAIVLTSALRGPHAGVLAGGPPAAAFATATQSIVTLRPPVSTPHGSTAPTVTSRRA